MLSSSSSRKTKSNVPALLKQHSESERHRKTERLTHVIDHDHQDHKPSVLQQNYSKERRSRRNNKKRKAYANASLFSLRAEEEENERRRR
jgi:hypothetical protein